MKNDLSRLAGDFVSTGIAILPIHPMILRAITGKLTLGAVLLTLASIGIRQVLRSRSHQEQHAQAITDRYAPAMNQLTDEALADSHWRYRGKAGELELHLAAGGVLRVTAAGGKTSQGTGTWSATHHMLTLSAPALEAEHQGIFRDSSEELVGPEPDGDGSWSATRVR